jgi:hypothetical protein
VQDADNVFGAAAPKRHAGDRTFEHVLCATGNSLDALVNLIIFDAHVTYLSFPISAPREMEANGDRSFIDIINAAHHLAANEMSARRSRSFISPLAIDELPIVFKFKKVPQGSTELEFNCVTDRWNLDELWGSKDGTILPCLTGLLKFPMDQIDNAESSIRTDVGWRDRRLVLQSDSLAIVCPKPPQQERITRGVNEEIETAVPLGILCYIWQKREWDPNDFVGTRFPPAGSMGMGHTAAVVQKVNTLEDLIAAKP